jgi:purine-binding chemotaxis protein CheW
MPDITKTPNVSADVEGVFNLERLGVPVISLRSRFNLGDREYNKATRILVMDVDNRQTGFVVDAVAEVIMISTSEIQDAPAMIQAGGRSTSASSVSSTATIGSSWSWT